MKILIAYATYSSGTETAARIVAEELQKNNEVTLKRVAELSVEEPDNYDLTVLCSPSWLNEEKEGQPHHDVTAFMKLIGDKKYEGKRFAVLGLGDSSYAEFCSAVDHLEAFVKKVQGALATPSLRIDGFYFNEGENSQKVREWAHSF